MNSRLLCCFLLPLLSVGVSGQSMSSPSQTPAAPHASVTAQPTAARDYAGESLVIDQLDRVYDYAADGTGSTLRTVRARIQSDAGLRALGVLNVGYASSAEHVEFVYARVRHSDGTVQETPASDAIDMPTPVTREAPFYSDLKDMQLPIRSMRVGDTLEWQARIIRTKPEAPGHFWGAENFSTDGVVLEESIELRVPQGKYVKTWSPTAAPVESNANGKHIYRWTSSQLKPTTGKEADDEKEKKKTHVLTADEEKDAEQGKLPTIAWTTFPSWDAVGAWYRDLVDDRTTPDAEIKAKVAEITAGKATDEERVRAVYAYVSTQIRYIGVAFGIGRYQPHRADDVLGNQYGDCKDKHTLLASMLRALGLSPDAVLIGAGVRFNPDVPSPGWFNHLITQVTVGGQPIWLDSTAEVAPYRMLSYVIRDRQALVIPQTGAARIETTPAGLPFDTFQKMEAVGSIDKDGVSNSRLTLIERGDTELQLRMAFRQTAPAQYDELAQQISQNMGYGGTVSHTEISRPDDTTEPFRMSYDYRREKAGDWPNLRIVPQLPPVSLPRPGDKDPAIQSIGLGVPRVESATSELKLPDGWTTELPEAVHVKSEYATYDETYRFDKGTLYAERKITVLKQKVPVAEWKAYKKWTDETDLGNELYVQLVVPKKDASGNTVVVSTVNNKEAKELLASTNTHLQQRNLQQSDFDSIRTDLDKVKALNPNQPGLWADYGMLDLRRGEMTAAIEDLKKELVNSPGNAKLYEGLAGLQSSVGRQHDAEETMRQWIQADPQNPIPYITLINALDTDKDGQGAVAVADAADKAKASDGKNDEMLAVAKGTAQITAGQKDRGAVTLVALLKSTDSPLMLNNAAYELAEANLELPLAEASTRTALAKMDEESSAWTLDENPQVLFAKTSTIVATWDTMGWILFREGKLDEAASYVRAAWLNSHAATEAEHLGDILAAQGKKDDALSDYELAIAATPQFDGLGAKKAPGADQKRIEAKASALRKSGAKTTVTTAPTEVQKFRTVPLGPANGRDGAAEYRLLLSGGKVKRAESSEDKKIADAELQLEKAELHDFWPADSKASLVRAAMFNCHLGACELVFFQ